MFTLPRPTKLSVSPITLNNSTFLNIQQESIILSAWTHFAGFGLRSFPFFCDRFSRHLPAHFGFYWCHMIGSLEEKVMRGKTGQGMRNSRIRRKSFLESAELSGASPKSKQSHLKVPPVQLSSLPACTASRYLRILTSLSIYLRPIEGFSSLLKGMATKIDEVNRFLVTGPLQTGKTSIRHRFIENSCTLWTLLPGDELNCAH